MTEKRAPIQALSETNAGVLPGSDVTLDAVASDPALVAGLGVEVIESLMLAAVRVQALLAAALVAHPRRGDRAADDRLLDVGAAAERLNVSRDWLYRRPKLPFVVRQGRMLRYSSTGIDAWIARRRRSA